MWELDCEEGWAPKNWCVWTVELEKTLESLLPLTARSSNQSILKEISPGISLEGVILKLKLQYFGHFMRRVDSLEKTLMLGGDWGQEEKGTTEDEMAGWHHRPDGSEFEWIPGDGDGQGGLACCNSWSCKESDMTERLNWTELRPRGIVQRPCEIVQMKLKIVLSDYIRYVNRIRTLVKEKKEG